MRPGTTGTGKYLSLAIVFAASLALAACSSDDDSDDAGNDLAGMPVENPIDAEGEGDSTIDPGGSQFNPNLVVVNFSLDSTITVPPATGAGSASGEAGFSVDTDTGVIAGTTTVSGTSGPATVAHIHVGGPGEAGPILIALDPNDDRTVWTVPEGAVLDAVAIDEFNNGRLYVNVHTDLNPDGELRGQLIDDANAAPAPGSISVTLVNTSESQPMSPPVVILHGVPGTPNGIQWFDVGQPAIGEVISIAEDGVFQPLVQVAEGQVNTVTAVDVAFTDRNAPGPLMPGASATVTLDVEAPDQVMTIIAMVVCTNDAFTGVDSRMLSNEASETFTTPIYDAGSENNVLTLDYWVPDCSSSGESPNITDDEGGAITLHPGQEGSPDPGFDFPAGSEFLQVTVVRN